MRYDRHHQVLEQGHRAWGAPPRKAVQAVLHRLWHRRRGQAKWYPQDGNELQQLEAGPIGFREPCGRYSLDRRNPPSAHLPQTHRLDSKRDAADRVGHRRPWGFHHLPTQSGSDPVAPRQDQSIPQACRLFAWPNQWESRQRQVCIG